MAHKLKEQRKPDLTKIILILTAYSYHQCWYADW